MPGMIKVAAVSFRQEIRDMLQRYVGGILKESAVVKAYPPEEAKIAKCDIYVVYTQGPVFNDLCQSVDINRMIPVELFPMPNGMKKVLSLPEGSHLGVLAGHLWCAADFLYQIIDIGAKNYHFSTGVPETASSMKVDWFVVPEEIEPYLEPNIRKKTIVVPRALDPQSVAKIIRLSLSLQNGTLNKQKLIQTNFK